MKLVPFLVESGLTSLLAAFVYFASATWRKINIQSDLGGGLVLITGFVAVSLVSRLIVIKLMHR